MCVIYACTSKIPDVEELKRAHTQNSDGIGLAFPDGHGRVAWVKGILSVEELLVHLEDKKPPVMLHFRMASSGGKNVALTHPFPINGAAACDLTGVANKVLSHNGHWNNWDDWVKKAVFRRGARLPNGPWSDSRAMAWLAHVLGEGVLQFFNQKICIMDGRGKMMLYNREGWQDKEGWVQSSPTDFFKVKGGGAYQDYSHAYLGLDDDDEPKTESCTTSTREKNDAKVVDAVLSKSKEGEKGLPFPHTSPTGMAGTQEKSSALKEGSGSGTTTDGGSSSTSKIMSPATVGPIATRIMEIDEHGYFSLAECEAVAQDVLYRLARMHTRGN